MSPLEAVEALTKRAQKDAYEDAIRLCKETAARYGELSAVSAHIAASTIRRRIVELGL